MDQVQTILQMSSMWLWEAVQRVLKALSRVSVFEDSALDWEWKLMLFRQVREYISLVL